MVRLLSAVRKMLTLAWQAHLGMFIGTLLLTLVAGIVPLGLAWISKLIFDLLGQGLGLNNTVNWSLLWILLGIQVLLTIISNLTAPGNTYLNAELTRQLTLKVQTLIFKKLNSFNGIAYFERPTFHDTIRLAQQGVQRSVGQALGLCMSLTRNTITLVSFLTVLFALSPLFALLLAISALPQLFAELKFGRERANLAFGLSPHERRKFFYSQLLSSAHAAKEVRFFNLGEFFLGRMIEDFTSIHEAEKQQQIGELRWNVGFGSLSGIVASISLIIVITQAFAGLITLGDLTLFIAAVASVQGVLSGMIYAVAGLHENTLFFNHYETLMALPPALPTVKIPQSVPTLTQGIEFRNVWFRYTSKHPWILKEVNLFIPKGKSVALVGLNGAGKTTMVKLLARLYDPTAGHILWDGIDIKELDITAYRERIGAVLQDFIRYDLTARENIGLGKLAYLNDQEKVEKAAQKAGIHKTLASLPQGYESVLSRQLFAQHNESGIDLSGGEWQRLALARMFMREADFLILDEPTAALDAKAEFELFKHFAKLMEGLTSLIISHRFSTVLMAALIAVLESGQIREFGSHEELMQRGNQYAELYSLQAQSLGFATHVTTSETK